VAFDCDPGSEAALETHAELTSQFKHIEQQVDHRYASEASKTYLDTLTRFTIAALQHSDASAKLEKEITGGRAAEFARAFGTMQNREGLTGKDYLAASKAHISSLVDYVNALKNGASDTELDASADRALNTAIAAGQVYWGRKWSPVQS
jgi:uncharacterized protein YicC (UPF0701 family)